MPVLGLLVTLGLEGRAAADPMIAAAGDMGCAATDPDYRRTGNGTWTRVGSATDTSIAAGGYVSFTLGDTTVRGGVIGGGSIEGGGT